jgi:glycosyltransferase involved in cell wall biosynthesis
MRVCHFSSVHHIWDTRVFYRECVSLATKYEVTLIAIGEKSGNINGVKVIGIPKPSSFLKRFTVTAFQVFREALHTDAQLYHIHDAEMVPYGIVLALSGKKVIYDIHENTYHDILLKPWVKPILKKIAAKSYNLLLRFAKQFLHFVVVVAHPRFLPSFFIKETKCTVIQNFADLIQLKPYRVIDRASLPTNEIFYIGMIRDMYYEVDPLLEAIYLLKQNGILVKLHLIGYFGSKANHGFSHLKYWKEIEAQVQYYGRLEMAEAYQISKQCKIGVCLKNQPAEMLVSHERKLFEYMAIGLPSIFANTHIYEELNEETDIGISVDLTDAKAIESTIKILLSNGVFLNQKAQNAAHASDTKYNWKIDLDKLFYCYEGLVQTESLKIN